MDYLRRTWAEIDIAALVHNFEIIKKDADGTPIMGVVKADCYGHSVKDIAPVLDKNGAAAFAVSNINEGIELRKIGITKPILILGYSPASMAKRLSEYDITQCVFSTEFAQKLSEYAQKDKVTIKIHIKLDTGMGRIGFDCRDDSLNGINQAIAAAKLPGLEFDGIFTHFCVADRNEQEEDGYTDKQYDCFLKGIKAFKKAGLNPRVAHCCNSAATTLDHEKHLDMCRPGITLYGLTPSSTLDLHRDFIPVMTLKSVVSMIKEIKPGTTLNYGRTFKADKPMRVATISAGYADGYPRLLSNKGSVILHGKRAPILGRICMDQFSIDVTDIPEAKPDDEVELFGKQLPVEEIADLCSTINYEITCDVSKRVPRVIINNT